MKNLLKRIVPRFIWSWYHLFLAFLGGVLYWFPAKKLKVIGVTGTNGKSTVVLLISQILEEAGYQVAAVSSIQFKIRDKTWPNTLKMTMPGRLKLQKFLSQAVRAGCHYAILEVTSEGIVQHRHRFIGFDDVVLTNLTPEHIESHGGFNNYKRAKGQLFHSIRPNGKMVVNLDDPHADYFLRFSASQKIGYGLDSQYNYQVNQLVRAENCQMSRQGVSFRVRDVDFQLPLLGRFNIYNALASLSVGLAEGVPLIKSRSALAKVQQIPGRLEIVIKSPFTVIVDYAHTPDALEKVYQTIKEVFQGHLIGVLGAAGGGRDKWKRKELGKVAGKYLDQIIITNEDPYDEDSQIIIEQIAQGVGQKPLTKIIDRRQAIRQALSLARPNDIVIITGKGSESWMCLASNRKIPWDDRQIVREERSYL